MSKRTMKQHHRKMHHDTLDALLGMNPSDNDRMHYLSEKKDLEISELKERIEDLEIEAVKLKKALFDMRIDRYELEKQVQDLEIDIQYASENEW